MIIFTFYGGMEAVIWVEVVQLGIYIGGAIAAAVVILNQIDGGMPAFWKSGSSSINSFVRFHVRFTKTYTFWAGLIGGCFLTMSTHGTDQYLVQRYLVHRQTFARRSLCCRAARSFSDNSSDFFLSAFCCSRFTRRLMRLNTRNAARRQIRAFRRLFRLRAAIRFFPILLRNICLRA
jgi:hypothetical protein